MKSTILMTTALFLASAPAPDSNTISEISAGFLSVKDQHGLMASESPAKLRNEPVITTLLSTRPATEY